uniref:Uncharacterized protein n=1 Tax=Lotus japonicus TaxID=34305 RepID=I3SCG6_LOTJA|nr:unknown [Lotus japonicus]
MAMLKKDAIGQRCCGPYFHNLLEDLTKSPCSSDGVCCFCLELALLCLLFALSCLYAIGVACLGVFSLLFFNSCVGWLGSLVV